MVSTYRSGPFQLLKEPRHGGRRGDQVLGASLGRRGGGAVMAPTMRGRIQDDDGGSGGAAAIIRETGVEIAECAAWCCEKTAKMLRVSMARACAGNRGETIRVAQARSSRALGAVVCDLYCTAVLWWIDRWQQSRTRNKSWVRQSENTNTRPVRAKEAAHAQRFQQGAGQGLIPQVRCCSKEDE